MAFVSLLGVLLVVGWASQEAVSPGPLHGAHRAVSDLQGAGGCARCHSEAGRALSVGCTECHGAVADQIARRRGLHGRLEGSIQPSACGRCHIEHVAGEVPLVGPHAFRLAGVEDPLGYDHRHVEPFALVGAHAALACAACHEHADVHALEAGQVRFLGVRQDCTHCHEDPHDDYYGPDCADCHGQQRAFAQVAEFEHDPRFPLRGGHAEVSCVECHERGVSPERAAATGDESLPVRACAACHADVHAFESRDLGCAACHDERAFAPATFSADRHAAFGLALTGPHADASCASCHERALRLPDIPSRDCAACHDSPHDPRFLAELPHPDDCSACHAFDDPSFRQPYAELPREWHAATGFPLETPHADPACAACHEPGAETAAFEQRFPGRQANECASCHGDVHGGQFGRGDPVTRCVECHGGLERWAPSSFDVDAHAETGFPLDGGHLAVDCSTCHRVPDDGSSARTFRGTSTACATCHDDPHAGRLVAPDGCARCHTTSAFAGVSWTSGDHAHWTGYALRGMHGTASCAACHGRPFVPDPPLSCAGCHDDPHAGQFREEGRNDCSQCHREDAPNFLELSFDHARDTRFPLDDNHARLGCDTCHVPHPTRRGLRVVRYRPLGRECVQCHDFEDRR